MAGSLRGRCRRRLDRQARTAPAANHPGPDAERHRANGTAAQHDPRDPRADGGGRPRLGRDRLQSGVAGTARERDSGDLDSACEAGPRRRCPAPCRRLCRRLGLSRRPGGNRQRPPAGLQRLRARHRPRCRRCGRSGRPGAGRPRGGGDAARVGRPGGEHAFGAGDRPRQLDRGVDAGRSYFARDRARRPPTGGERPVGTRPGKQSGPATRPRLERPCIAQAAVECARAHGRPETPGHQTRARWIGCRPRAGPSERSGRAAARTPRPRARAAPPGARSGLPGTRPRSRWGSRTRRARAPLARSTGGRGGRLRAL